ncbi:MAG TPA: sulfotransferase [Luteimonas sp.]|nr:sulfotransferase [Luteimonas sp.]
MSPPAQLPPHLQQAFGQAMALAARGDLRQATDLILRVRDGAPDSVEATTLASVLMLQQGRYRAARRLALQASTLRVQPGDLLRIARLLRRFEESEALERMFLATPWRELDSAPALAELAQLLGFSGLYQLAFECLTYAGSIDPASPDVHYLRGLFRMFSGDMAGSRDSVRRALELEPRMVNAHWLLSMQEKADSAEAHVAAMLRVLGAAEPGSEARAGFDYSLHHSYHALGRHAEAWQALAHGHATLRRLTRYSRREQGELVAALERMTLPAFAPAPEPAGQTGLIFIVGMFRSGTTLLERLLAGHPDVQDGGETSTFSACMRDATDCDGDQPLSPAIVARAPHVDFAAVRARMQQFANWRAPEKRWLTEKLPSNFLHIGFILHALPEARILHMHRDPVDTCFSNLRTLFRGGAPYACDQEDLADYYVQYRRLMAHWHAIAPGRVLDVDYARFVADPEAQARRVMAHCGLDYVPGALDIGSRQGMAATASAAHVRQGVLKNRGQAWKPYEAQLQPLIRGLREVLDDDAGGGAGATG